ncbi:carboxypeptidase regulatory-like domain-containing protein [Edaphobacter flagellatus]|uniref:carboxypeptidase regulatory-like domain-containing protein n=1 Tax=Edaphobacter flagellatus TaxID=1933044 RepID=UPI0021B2FB4F|nr:carboxypeptidase regulatory-like domain-containing protein [Edaphobacter flagellatus]
MKTIKTKLDERYLALREYLRLWLRASMFLALLLMMFLLNPHALRGQTGQGTIAGTVRDSSDAVVPDALVDVFNTATGVRQSAKTNGLGIYNVISLNPGVYEVTVTKTGFEKALTSSVTVSAAQATTVNVSLRAGRATEVVTVTSMDALLSKDTSDVTTTVDHAVVESLPYPERSSLEASLLVPGVNGDPLQPGGVATENPNAYTSYVVPGASISIGGAPPGTNSILVDGSDVTQGSYARAGVNLSGRDVQETTVVVTGLSAKYGRTSSGVIVQTSKPGTNEYHGAITWRHTDPYFNAFPLGNSAANALHENYYGFYIGGPVWLPKIYNGHDKTFFYVGVEPARMRNRFAFRGTFPTPDELSGHLHNSLALLNQSILKSQGYAAALAAPRIGTINYQSTVDANGFPNGPFSQSQIRSVPNDDVSQQLAKNPLAQFVLSQFPTPSNPGPYIKFDSPNADSQNDGTNAVYGRGVINEDNRYSFRIDHQFNNANQIFVRYTVIPVIATRFFAVDATNPLTIVPSDAARTHNIAVGYTHLFSNSVVNVFRYSFLRVNQQRLAPHSAQSQDYAAKYGLTPATFGKGFPSLGNLNANGVAYTMQMGVGNAAQQVDQNFIVGDDVTWTLGRHVFQFGVDVRWIQSNQYDLSGATGGKYTFSGNQTNNGAAGGAPLATFILGTISTFSNTPVTVPGYYRWRYYAGYFQDDWRVTPKLTLNLGVRYEVETPRSEKFNNQAYLAFTPGNLNGFATSTAFCFSGACGLPRSMWPTNFYGLEPRIGIAYAPTERMTVRAAYMMSRLPLSGYENVPDPNFNVSSQTVTYLSGGVSPNAITNYITNPVGPLTSAYTALNGNRGPILYSTGLAPVYISHSNAVPYSQTWSLTMQYQAGTKTLLQATYQGLKGTHLAGAFNGSNNPGNRNLNVPGVGQLVTAVQNHANLNFTSPNQWGITQNGALIPESNLQLLNPYQNFFNQPLPEVFPRIGTSEYNGFYASINQRFGSGFSLLANYSWSKSLDNVPNTNTGANSGGFGAALAQNPLDLSNEWAVASYDQPSRLKAGYVYQLPLGRGKRFDGHNWLVNQLIGNLTTSGIFTMGSGFPAQVVLGTSGYFTSFTPKGTAGCTTSGNNQYCSGGALPANFKLRPNIVPGVPLINKNWKQNVFNGQFVPYLNPAAFATPGSPNNPALGNAPRTLAGARSPRETMFDAMVSKGFSFTERYKVNVTGTFSNAFNHPVYYGSNGQLQSSVTTNNVTGVVTPVTSSTFGQFNAGQTAGMSRIIRVGAEFIF